MTTRSRPSSLRNRPVLAYVLLSGVAVVIVAAISLSARSSFARFLGGVPPVAAFAGAAVLGAASFAAVLSPAGFVVFPEQPARGAKLALEAAVLFGAIIVSADFLIVYPRDLNVGLPLGLVFYPAMAFLAETLFHVVPLSVLALPLRFIESARDRDRWTMGSLVATALLEPGYQALTMAGSSPSWAAVFTFFHVLGIDGVGLWLFRRHGFAAMLSLRVLYYFIGHVGWGALRLHLLFQASDRR